GQHRGHELALVADLLLGDREALRDVLLLRHERWRRRVRARKLALEVARGVDAHHAGSLARVGDVDALDARVGVRAAHECGERGALAHEIIDVVAVACDQPRIFAAVDLGSDKLADSHVSCPPPRRWSSWPAIRSWSSP